MPLLPRRKSSASLMHSLQPRRGRSTLTLQQLRARSNAMATWDRQGRGCRTADVCSACDICSSFSRWNTFRCMSSQCSSSCHHSNQSLLSHSTSSKINPFVNDCVTKTLSNNVNWKDETLANNNQRLRDQDSGQQRSIIAALANNVNDCVLFSLGLDWGKEDSFNQSSFEN